MKNNSKISKIILRKQKYNDIYTILILDKKMDGEVLKYSNIYDYSNIDITRFIKINVNESRYFYSFYQIK